MRNLSTNTDTAEKDIDEKNIEETRTTVLVKLLKGHQEKEKGKM